MARNEVISLRDPLPLDIGEQEGFNLGQADSRQRVSNGKRPCVLVGSAILQLPIWGR